MAFVRKYFLPPVEKISLWHQREDGYAFGIKQEKGQIIGKEFILYGKRSVSGKISRNKGD